MGRDRAELLSKANAESATLAVASTYLEGGSKASMQGPLLRALDALPQLVSIYGADLRFRYMNRAARELVGLPLEQVIGRTSSDLFPDEPPANYLPLIEKALASKQTVTQETTRVLPGHEAKRVVCSLSYTPVLGDTGETEGVVGVTFMKPFEVGASHFQALVESHSYAITTATLAGVTLSWNHGAELLFGYSAEEIVGKGLGLLITELDQTLIEIPERVQHGVVELEGRLRRKNGTFVDVFVTASPVRGDAGEVTAMAIIMRDISDRKELQRRVQSLSQLEAVARLAAGVAHDINNVLTIVNTYASFVATAPLSPEQQADLNVAKDAATRGATLVSQLLALGQDRGAQLVTVEVGEVARGIDEMLRRTLGGGIDLAVQHAAGPLPVRAAIGQIDQILLNLALNARDAMPGGGALTISVRNSTVDSGHPLSSELAPGPYAVIAVKDTGVGMDKETQARAFEPFFTTRKRGDGTGLGLLIVQEIVKQLRGAIRLNSVVGEGTEFLTFLPIHEQRPRTESPPPLDLRPAGPKTILVVDDDTPIRNGLRRILRAEGYVVLEAADGLEAIDVAANHPGRIDLLLCDLLMPRVGGQQTLARIRSARPEIRAVVISGQLAAADAFTEGAGFIQKPFTKEAVASVIAKTLERSPTNIARPLPARPIVLIVDDSLEFRESLVRLLEESNLIMITAKSGLHALQVLENDHVDLILADQFMPGIDGVRLLELVRDRWPHCQRVLFTGYASSDIVLEAVNRGGAHKVLVKSMHPIAVRNEIEAAALGASQFRELNPR